MVKQCHPTHLKTTIAIHKTSMKVVEFFGMPRSGKTEQIQRLSKYLKSRDIEQHIITDREIEREIKIPVDMPYLYNQIFFEKIDKKLLKAKNSKKFEIVILDRGFFDREVWFNVEYALKSISVETKKIALKEQKNLTKKIDFAIMLMVDINTSLQRHKKKGEIGLTEKVVLEKRYLNTLYKEYLKLKRKLKKNKKVLILNGKQPTKLLEKKIRKTLESNKIIRN